ncbi:MAG: chloride channel protein [Oscillospiraceae bacterium]|nr:chloride channel protein [Oscillospiraceae bacterium]
MAFSDKLRSPKKYLHWFCKWSVLGVLMGTIGGLLGAVFHHALHFVTHLRQEHTWLVLLLPIGGLLSVAWYRLLKLKKNRGTNEIIDAVLDGEELRPQIAPGIFGAAMLTHLFGGSAGREGAALQLGGSVASIMSKLLKLDRRDRRMLVMAGMSSVFAGLFGTPLTAALFCMEFESVGTIFSPALLPCYLAAFTASSVSAQLGVHAEGVAITTFYNLDPGVALSCGVLAVLISLVGIAMCRVFHEAEHLAAHHIKNPWVRIFAGGVLIAAMTMAVGDHRFNGAGMDMALGAIAGNGEWYYFLVKMLFTAVTLAAGFKGGEIVPTFCIGATFGLLAGGWLGMEPEIAAALGLVGLFCCATNSPLASIVLSVEMFGSTNLHLFALVCVICFVMSGQTGLYSSQINQFDKISSIPQPRKSE